MFALFPFLPQGLMHPNDDAALGYFRYGMALFWESALEPRIRPYANFWLASALQNYCAP
jgi:hypothetical protein